MRAGHTCGVGVSNCRITYTSDDLGATWTKGTLHPEMADPGCKGIVDIPAVTMLVDMRARGPGRQLYPYTSVQPQ